MSLRPTKSKPIKETPPEAIITTGPDQETREKPPPPSSSFSQQALASTAHLANLLPTGTLLAFQLLTPVFTNHGSCDAATRAMTQALLLILAASCSLACFTDSFRSPSDGRLYYGLATPRGIWLFDYYTDAKPTGPSDIPDLAKYRLRPIDFVHAVLSVLVFAAVAMRDKNVVNCFYPRPEQQTQEVLDVLPLGVGLACSLLFVIFPTRRHGIGYPITDGR